MVCHLRNQICATVCLSVCVCVYVYVCVHTDDARGVAGPGLQFLEPTIVQHGHFLRTNFLGVLEHIWGKQERTTAIAPNYEYLRPAVRIGIAEAQLPMQA